MAVPVVIVVAVADNGVIGDDNRLIWRLRTDLRRFRSLTVGQPVLMGRKTFQSIGAPLPKRETIVLTRDSDYRADGVTIAHSLEEALQVARDKAGPLGAQRIVVAGGSNLYAQALPVADELELTWVHASPQGDAHFPDWEGCDFVEVGAEHHPAGPDDEHPFTFATFRRRG